MVVGAAGKHEGRKYRMKKFIVHDWRKPEMGWMVVVEHRCGNAISRRGDAIS